MYARSRAATSRSRIPASGRLCAAHKPKPVCDSLRGKRLGCPEQDCESDTLPIVPAWEPVIADYLTDVEPAGRRLRLVAFGSWYNSCGEASQRMEGQRAGAV